MALTVTEAILVAQLRELTGITDTTDPHTDEQMLARITLDGSAEEAAAVIWTSKAASYATLTDVNEGASSRKLSQLHGNALTMAATIRGGVTAELTAGKATHIRPIVRD